MPVKRGRLNSDFSCNEQILRVIEHYRKSFSALFSTVLPLDIIAFSTSRDTEIYSDKCVFVD